MKYRKGPSLLQHTALQNFSKWAKRAESWISHCVSDAVRFYARPFTLLNWSARMIRTKSTCNKVYTIKPEAKFLDIIGVSALLVFTVTSTNGFTLPPLPPSGNGLRLICYVNIVYENLKSEKPQRNCTFMNSAPGSSRSTSRNQDLISLGFLSL